MLVIQIRYRLSLKLEDTYIVKHGPGDTCTSMSEETERLEEEMLQDDHEETEISTADAVSLLILH